MEKSNNVTPLVLIRSCVCCGRDFVVRPSSFGDLAALRERPHLCPPCERREQKARAA